MSENIMIEELEEGEIYRVGDSGDLRYEKELANTPDRGSFLFRDIVRRKTRIFSEKELKTYGVFRVKGKR